jgi:hypothetical protein
LPDATICKRSDTEPTSQFHLEVRLADGAPDLRNGALAYVDRVAGRLVVGADERKRKGVARERDIDCLGRLDLAKRVGRRLGEGTARDQPGGNEQTDD